jgi:hypothetical protein
MLGFLTAYTNARTLHRVGLCNLWVITCECSVVPAPGLELGTYRLQGGCSTN